MIARIRLAIYFFGTFRLRQPFQAFAIPDLCPNDANRTAVPRTSAAILRYAFLYATNPYLLAMRAAAKTSINGNASSWHRNGGSYSDEAK
jgi:hypothetical protein